LTLMAVQLATGDPVFFLGNRDYLIPTGFSSDQHKNAFLVTISYAFIQSYLVGNRFKFFGFVFFLVCFLFILIGSSRAGLVAFVVATAFIFIKGIKLKDSLMLLIFGLGSALLLLVMLVSFAADNTIYHLLPDELLIAYEATIMKYSNFISDSSVGERIMLWTSFASMGDINLLKLLTFGLGPGAVDHINSQTMHNTPLDILFSVGAIGLLSISVIIFRIVRRAATGEDGHDGFALSAVIVSIIVFSMFHDFGRARFLWIFLGLAACSYYRQATTNFTNTHRSENHENPARGHRA